MPRRDIILPGFDLSEFIERQIDDTVRHSAKVFVDSVSGDDSTGLRTYQSRPFATIAAAVAAAQSADTVVIRPGTWTERNYLKNGVNFLADGPVTLHNTTNDFPMFSDEATIGIAGDAICDFFGPFLFKDTQTPATGGRNHGIIQITRAGSRIRLFDIIGMSSEPANTTGNPCCIHVSAGTVETFGSGTYLDSSRYDPVIMKSAGSGVFRANVDRLRADILATGCEGNCLEIGSGNTCDVTANDATSGGAVAMRLNGTCNVTIHNFISGVTGGIVTNTGAVAYVRAGKGIKATGAGPSHYAILHQAGSLEVHTPRIECVGTDDVAILVNAAGLKVVGAEVVVSGAATESVGVGGDPMSVMFRNCVSNKALHGDVTSLLGAGHYAVDTDIS